jgi:hypothetical protein
MPSKGLNNVSMIKELGHTVNYKQTLPAQQRYAIPNCQPAADLETGYGSPGHTQMLCLVPQHTCC